MRVEVKFIINKDIKYRKPINEAVTAFIYKAISLENKKFGSNLHDEGFSKSGKKNLYIMLMPFYKMIE